MSYLVVEQCKGLERFLQELQKFAGELRVQQLFIAAF
jgi:hypothetical protein